MGRPQQLFRIKSFGGLAMTFHIECWDLKIPSLGIYTTLTKVPCGQWVSDFGTSGVMRLTYLGQQDKKRVSRFGIRMVSNDDKAWVLAKMDVVKNQRPPLWPEDCSFGKKVQSLAPDFNTGRHFDFAAGLGKGKGAKTFSRAQLAFF